MFDHVILEVFVEASRSTNEKLLKDCYNVWVIISLSSQSIDNCRNVDFSCSKQRRVAKFGKFTASSWLQKVNVGWKTHFCHNLEFRVAFFDGFVDKNWLSVEHLIVDQMTLSGGWILPQNDSFIRSVNSGSPQNFQEKRWTINEENSWKLGDRIPNIRRNALQRCNDYNVLLSTFQILGSQRQNEVHDGRMDSAHDDMILKSCKLMFLRDLHLSLGFR